MNFARRAGRLRRPGGLRPRSDQALRGGPGSFMMRTCSKLRTLRTRDRAGAGVRHGACTYASHMHDRPWWFFFPVSDKISDR